MLPPVDQGTRTALLSRPTSDDLLSHALTIVIPAFNEEHSIVPVIEQVREAMLAFPHDYEILVVDDGSADRTAEQAHTTGVRVVSHRQNRGYGEALKTGIRHAEYQRIAIIDADGSYPAQEIPRLAALLDDADMVVGARTGANAAIPLIRRPAKKTLTWLASYLTGTRIPDLNSGLRLFKRALAIEFFDLLPSKFSFTTTITLAALNSGYLVEYAEVDYYKRTGRSKIRPIQDTFNFFMLVLRMTLIFRPLKIYLPIAAVLFLLAPIVLGIGWFGFHKIFDNTALILLFAGFQLAAIGLLADVVNVRRSRAPSS
ncbi:MAG: glycosyltransferase family 2 protein [Chloroflexi bacterium]|nr:glycosyltransferase family 2 protein [Chloroflexota bacterium]